MGRIIKVRSKGKIRKVRYLGRGSTNPKSIGYLGYMKVMDIKTKEKFIVPVHNIILPRKKRRS